MTGRPHGRRRYDLVRAASRVGNVVCGVEAFETARSLRTGWVEGRAAPVPPPTVVGGAERVLLHPAERTLIAPPPRPRPPVYPYPFAHPNGAPAVLERPPFGCWSLPGASWFSGLGVVFAGEHDQVLEGCFRFPLRFTRVLDTRWRTARVERVPGAAMGLETDFDDNHYHNLVDLGPRVAMLAHPWFRQFGGITLFSTSIGRNPVLAHLVRRLAPDDVRVVEVDDHVSIRPDVLLMPDPAMGAWDCVPSQWYLDALRRHVVDVDLAEHDAGGRGDGEPLYISRGGAAKRRLIGEDHLIAALTERGFRSVRTETCDPGEIVRLMARAPAVVAMLGAGLANTLYCAPGTRVVEISSVHHWTPELYFIAQAAGLSFRSSVAPAGDADVSRWRGAKYHQLPHRYYRRRDADLVVDSADVCRRLDEEGP